MGFLKPSAPSVSSTPTLSDPPIVTEVSEVDAQADYDQKSSRRKGLLSTILAGRSDGSRGLMSSSAPHSKNSTLG